MASSPIQTRAARAAAPPIRRYGAQVFAELARITNYVDPNLAASWSAIAGEDLARLCRPGRLSGGRIGRTLEVIAADGAAAALVQFEAESLRRNVNDFLGPGAVGRIYVRQAGQRSDGASSAEGSPLGGALSRFRASVSARGKGD